MSQKTSATVAHTIGIDTGKNPAFDRPRRQGGNRFAGEDFTMEEVAVFPSSKASRSCFAYLFLVALYESWIIPVPVLLSVSVGTLGSFAAIRLGGLTLDLYAQIGIIMLIGLAAKNGIRNVEIREGEERSGNAITRGGDRGGRDSVSVRSR